MKRSVFGRHVLSICVAAAMLAGCGGSQPPIGAPGAMPQTSAIATHADRGKSWMLAGASGNDLIYVTAWTSIEVFSYPGLKNVGKLSGFENAEGLCADNAGNVYVVDNAKQEIFGYAHGDSNPFVTLSDSGNYPIGCAVDPTTGNLGVVGGYNHIAPANIAIFPNASGSPTMYYPPVSALEWCTYDNRGNLFMTFQWDGTIVKGGVWVSELPQGSGNLTNILVTADGYSGGDVKWDGKYFAIENPHWNQRNGPSEVYRVQISGSSAKIVKAIELKKRGWKDMGAEFALLNGTIITAASRKQRVVGLWNYPHGGNPTGRFISDDVLSLGVVVSVSSKK